MNAKKFWATLVYALILVSVVLTVPSSSPAYAQAKTHLGVSPVDMIILFNTNTEDFDGIFYGGFKIMNPDATFSDFFSVPEGKMLIITDISTSADEQLPAGYTIKLWNVIVADGEVVRTLVPYKCNLTGLTNHQFSFTSGLTFYPHSQPAVSHTVYIPPGKVATYLYGYLIDAPPLPQLRHPGPPMGPPFPPLKPPIDK